VAWEVLITDEVDAFLNELFESDRESHRLVNQAILVLEQNGPAEGRPLVDTITASKIANMKELRPPSSGRTEIRILFVFDPWRAAILLVGRGQVRPVDQVVPIRDSSRRGALCGVPH
jgi:hypothetical protein